MRIPKSFTLLGNEIPVNIIDSIKDNSYGYWNDATEEIAVANTVKSGSDVITLKDKQKYSTFLHEVIHAIQWYTKAEYNEAEAQLLSSTLTEIIFSSKFEEPF